MTHEHHHNHEARGMRPTAEHSNMVGMHGSAGEYLKRFWIVTFLLIPLVFTNEMVTELLGIGMLPFAQVIGLIITTIIFSFSFVFFQHALHEIKARKYGIMTHWVAIP